MIARANDTHFGLAAGIWTNDLRRAHRGANALRAGTVWINGGMKMSGFGRENGLDSLDGYTTVKTVWVELSGQTRDPCTVG